MRTGIYSNAAKKRKEKKELQLFDFYKIMVIQANLQECKENS